MNGLFYFCKKHFNTFFIDVFVYVVKAKKSIQNNNKYTSLHTKRIGKK